METIKDILDKMRRGVIPKHRHDRELLQNFADRIEQAVTNRNQFKMREALKEIRATLSVYHITSLSNQETVDTFRKVIEQALSTPPRNCDLYTSRMEAFEEWLIQNSQQKIVVIRWVDFIDWLFAEVKGDVK